MAWKPEARGSRVLRLVVVLWGTTAFGVIHVLAEYRIMIRFSRWDTPPGYGYFMAAVITISAISTVIMYPTHAKERRGR